ncbi:hypothetical protein RRG08_038340 [Elysia crispata]|uniref:Uncharacterized protein n=1 Tax=Elysia crispata TaxID=231223 RepID=A0AAE1AMY9_9GAST|nr:hypothetical protein RRG08_038340 [Elysia crispata]
MFIGEVTHTAMISLRATVLPDNHSLPATGDFCYIHHDWRHAWRLELLQENQKLSVELETVGVETVLNSSCLWVSPTLARRLLRTYRKTESPRKLWQSGILIPFIACDL